MSGTSHHVYGVFELDIYTPKNIRSFMGSDDLMLKFERGVREMGMEVVKQGECGVRV